MIILFSSKNPASLNIAQNLMEKGFVQNDNYLWEYGSHKMIDTKAESILDVPTNFETDCILVLSTHKSKEYKKMLTCHAPGNWGTADFGGENKTLNIVPASKLKTIVLTMKKLATEKLPDFDVQMEVDHHGPTCSVPILYVEIGPTEKEFTNKIAGEIAASAIIESIKSNKKYSAAIGFGGGHYPERFNNIIFDEKNVSIGHIMPKYQIKNLDEDLFRQAVEKSVEKVEKAIILRKEFNLEQKAKIKELCQKSNVEYVEI